MNDVDSVVEFRKGARIFEVAQQLQALNLWDHYQVEVGLILACNIVRRLVPSMIM